MIFHRQKRGKKSKLASPKDDDQVCDTTATSVSTISTIAMPTDDNDDAWSEDRFEAMLQLWQLHNVQDVDNMKELQRRLQDIDHVLNDPFQVVRFYKESKNKVSIAETKFREMIHWRRENAMDSFFETYGKPDKVLSMAPSVVLKGFDREGDPIFVERTGSFDILGFHRRYGTNKLRDFLLYRLERDILRHPSGWQQMHYEPLTGHPVKQITVIMDMEGLNRSHLNPALLPLTHQTSRIIQDYYVAGLIKRVIVLRAPPIFNLLWSLVKHFFDESIRDLITVTTSSNYLQVLDKYIDREVLPSCICPQHGKGQVMPGFEHVRIEGGSIESFPFDLDETSAMEEIDSRSDIEIPIESGHDSVSCRSRRILRGDISQGRVRLTSCQV